MTSNLEINIKGFRKLVKGKESVSKGYQSKFTDGEYWVKLDKEGRDESLAEEFTSNLLKLSTLNKESFVEYKRCEVYDGDNYLGKGCISRNFVKKGESIITFQRLFDVTGFDSSDIFEAVNENDSLTYEVKKIVKKSYKIRFI